MTRIFLFAQINVRSALTTVIHCLNYYVVIYILFFYFFYIKTTLYLNLITYNNILLNIYESEHFYWLMKDFFNYYSEYFILYNMNNNNDNVIQ